MCPAFSFASGGFARLITVASSPHFSAENGWPGIKPEVLRDFEHQLSEDFQRTVERFLALQTMGTDSARQDARLLKSVVLEQPMPSVEVLNKLRTNYNFYLVKRQFTII